MQDPMEMARGVLALRDQAIGMTAAYQNELRPSGRGFSADDHAMIAAAAAHHRAPPATPYDTGAAEEVSAAAMRAEYPATGIPPHDPRLQAAAGLSLVAYATAARAIGWGWQDDALVCRVCAALGIEPATLRAGSEMWTERLRNDVVLGTLYGQLYLLAAPT